MEAIRDLMAWVPTYPELVVWVHRTNLQILLVGGVLILIGLGLERLPTAARRIGIALLMALVLSTGAVFATPVRPAFWVVCPPFGFLYVIMWCWL